MFVVYQTEYAISWYHTSVRWCDLQRRSSTFESTNKNKIQSLGSFRKTNVPQHSGRKARRHGFQTSHSCKPALLATVCHWIVQKCNKPQLIAIHGYFISWDIHGYSRILKTHLQHRIPNKSFHATAFRGKTPATRLMTFSLEPQLQWLLFNRNVMRNQEMSAAYIRCVSAYVCIDIYNYIYIF